MWTIGIFFTWQTAHSRLVIPDGCEVPRGWRAIILLAEAIKQELAKVDIDPHSMTDRQLKAEIQNQLRGGAITLEGTTTPTCPRRFREWIRRNKWWHAATLITAIFASTIWMAYYWGCSPRGAFFTFWSWGIFGALLLTQMFFRTSNSRLFISFWLQLLAFIIALVMCNLLVGEYRSYHWEC